MYATLNLFIRNSEAVGCRNSRPELFCKRSVLKYPQVFPWKSFEFRAIFKTTFFIEQFWWLLLLLDVFFKKCVFKNFVRLTRYLCRIVFFVRVPGYSAAPSQVFCYEFCIVFLATAFLQNTYRQEWFWNFFTYMLKVPRVVVEWKQKFLEIPKEYGKLRAKNAFIDIAAIFFQMF